MSPSQARFFLLLYRWLFAQLLYDEYLTSFLFIAETPCRTQHPSPPPPVPPPRRTPITHRGHVIINISPTLSTRPTLILYQDAQLLIAPQVQYFVLRSSANTWSNHPAPVSHLSPRFIPCLTNAPASHLTPASGILFMCLPSSSLARNAVPRWCVRRIGQVVRFRGVRWGVPCRRSRFVYLMLLLLVFLCVCLFMCVWGRGWEREDIRTYSNKVGDKHIQTERYKG